MRREKRELGWPVTGICKDCRNRNICELWNKVYRAPALVYEGDFDAQILKCKWYIKEKEK